MRGHALGVLFDVMRFRAKDPILNDLSGAMALLVAPFGADLRVAHIWSEKNSVCDRLSRLAENERHGLNALSGVMRSKPVRLTPEALGDPLCSIK